MDHGFDGLRDLIMSQGAQPSTIYLSSRGAKRLRVAERMAAYRAAWGYSWRQLAWHDARAQRRKHGLIAWWKVLYRAVSRHYHVSVRIMRRGGYMDDYPKNTIVLSIHVPHLMADIMWFDRDVTRKWRQREGWLTFHNLEHNKHVWQNYSFHLSRLGIEWYGWRRR